MTRRPCSQGALSYSLRARLSAASGRAASVAGVVDLTRPACDAALPAGGAHLSSDGLRRLRHGLAEAGIDAAHFPWPPPGAPDRPPYPGLRALDAPDADIVFGREGQLTLALDQLCGLRETVATGLFAILGASGEGKSSFLGAVLPVVRPGRAALSGETGLVAADGRGGAAAGDRGAAGRPAAGRPRRGRRVRSAAAAGLHAGGLWREEGATGRLTLAGYEAAGGLKGAIEAAVARALGRADGDRYIPLDPQARLALLRRGFIPWLAGIDPETAAPCAGRRGCPRSPKRRAR